MYDPKDDIILKHKKKKDNDVSKSKNKSKHKHSYANCLYTRLVPYFNTITYLEGTYCTICGKIGNVHFPWGINSKNEIKEDFLKKHKELPVFNISYDQKYIPIENI